MQKLIVFTESEWTDFQRQFGEHLETQMSAYEVKSKSDDSVVDDRVSDFWHGVAWLAISAASREQSQTGE